MDITDLNNALEDTTRTLWDATAQLEALQKQAKELHESEDNRYNFEYAINRMDNAQHQLTEAIQALPNNFNG